MLITACFGGYDCDEVAYLAYDYSLSEVTCQQWDDVNEVWGSNSCEVLPGSTATQTRFKSNLFGSYGAGITVAPNTIDFSTVFNNLDRKLIEVRSVSLHYSKRFQLVHLFSERCRSGKCCRNYHPFHPARDFLSKS